MHAALGSWQWMAAITLYGKLTCGGTIIHERLILTAAHCLVDSKSNILRKRYLAVRVGDIFWDFADIKKVAVKHIYIHEDFIKYSYTNDVALLELESPLKLLNKSSKKNADLMPICMPPLRVYYNRYSRCYILGWGLPFDMSRIAWRLRESYHTLIDSRLCQLSTSANWVTNKKMCSASGDSRATGREGDSGGPVVCLSGKNYWYQAGIISHANRDITVFTKVREYEGWIRNIAETVNEKYRKNTKLKELPMNEIVPLKKSDEY
ncbi:hypothetical protein SNEBB_005643 [Seison nebaliae]|nr:hypothetical protein SNEBB_005643 [Seison nebaliae]